MFSNTSLQLAESARRCPARRPSEVRSSVIQPRNSGRDASEATEAQRPAIEAAIADLEAAADRAQKKLDELTASGGEAWEEIRVGVRNAGHELGQAVEQAASRFEKE